LAECPVGHHHVAPDGVEDNLPVYRFVSLLDEQDQEIEVAGDERQLLSASKQDPPRRRNGEVGELVARFLHRTTFRALRINRESLLAKIE
jgi:hypothetical protein